MAEVDALGPQSAQPGSELGAAAAFDRRDLRAGNGRARDRAASRSTASQAGDETRGHRFMAPGAFKVRRFDDYVAKLEKAKVVLDPARRAEMILADAKNLAFAQGYELVEDEGLLAEVAGLVEWPVTLMGSFDQAFLAIPAGSDPRHHPHQPEMLRAARSADGEARQQIHPGRQRGGERRRQGDRRRQRARHPRAAVRRQVLLRHRSEDAAGGPAAEIRARSCSTRSSARRPSASRASRRWPASSRRWSAPTAAKAERAAQLCKADLLTEVVGEFPELQGLMGRYYAEAQGEDEAVAHAMRGSLQAEGPGRSGAGRSGRRSPSRSPTRSTRWSASGRSTKSRPARRILTRCAAPRWASSASSSRTNCGCRCAAALAAFRLGRRDEALAEAIAVLHPLHEEIVRSSAAISNWRQARSAGVEKAAGDRPDARAGAFLSAADHDLLAFFADRLKVQLREQGARHDLVDAVFALDGQDDLLMIVRRVEALGKFLDTDDGKNLLAGVKRASNILRIEEKKDKQRLYRRAGRQAAIELPEEKALAEAIDRGQEGAVRRRRQGRLRRRHDARWRSCAPTVDAFFDKVTVNVDDKALRENRLKLLNEIREATRAVADFSKIEG